MPGADLGAGRDLRALPKAHLRLHLEGAMRPATMRELAERQGLAPPATGGSTSFGRFLELYCAACGVLRTPDHLRRLVREVAEDAAADGEGGSTTATRRCTGTASATRPTCSPSCWQPAPKRPR